MENEGSSDLLKLVGKYFAGSLVFFLVAIKFVTISAIGCQLLLLLVAAYLFLLASFKFIELVDAEDCLQCLYCTPWIILFFWILLFYSFSVIASDNYSSEQYLLSFYVKIILLATSCIIFVKLLRYFAGRQYQRVLLNTGLVITVTCVLLVRASYYRSLDDMFVGLEGRRLSNRESSCQLEPVSKPWMTLLPNVISSKDIKQSVVCGEVKRHFCHMFLGMVTIDGSCAADSRVIVLNDDQVSSLANSDSGSICKNLSRLLPVGMKRVSINYSSPLYYDRSLKYVNCFCEDDENIITVVPPPLPPPSGTSAENAPNVLMVLVNSVSRSQFMNHLPKTVDFLETLSDNGFSVFQFFRYHAVGRGFRENFLPLMSGHPMTNIPITNDGMGSMFPWSVFKKNRGFETAWISNECADNFVYNFREPYNLDHEIVLPFCHRKFREYTKPENFDGPFPLEKRCIGSRSAHDYLFDYVLSMANRDRTRGKFTMAHLFGGQEGGSEMLSQIDKSFSSFLSSYIGHMRNTVTIIASDVGHNQGVYVNSAYGKLDKNLPALYVVIHNSFLEKHVNLQHALLMNEQRLVTPYDVHQTLHHLAVYPSNIVYSERTIGKSLLEDIPAHRSCADAGIPTAECVCM